MGRIQWARASQFNWAFDNMGGTPLQEAVAGSWQQGIAQVAGDGSVVIAAPQPGAGQVYWVRGVWKGDTQFPWSGFWVDPMGGDLTNYFLGGSFHNEGAATVISLGTPLAPDTPVQLYYIYATGEKAAKFEPLNNYPAIRRAYRSRDDYTYDFAVDRILDLMGLLEAAGRERGQDYGPLIRFLWDAFQQREASLTSPLIQDSFERQLWDRGAYLMYREATAGMEAFKIFASELANGASGRALHVKAELPTGNDSAWFGYGLDWSLTTSPFTTMDRLSFLLQGMNTTWRLHALNKSGSGGATLMLQGDYLRPEKRMFVVQAETSGQIGTATFRWSRDGGVTWEAEGLVTGDTQHPVILEEPLSVYWQSGGGTDLVPGDYWTFWGGDPLIHPRRLLVTLNDSSPADGDAWGPDHTYLHVIPDRFPEMTPFEIPFTQFWRLGNIIDDCDRVQALWGPWYSTTQQDTSDITIGTKEETEILLGDTFYTQRLITWSLSPYVTCFGAWAGIDTSRCNSAGRTTVNFLVKPVVGGLSNLTLRVKVKDARGSYFYQDVAVLTDQWQRVTVALAEMAMESGAFPLTHPLQVVDIGIPAAPPSNGELYLADLKFDEHFDFSQARHLRVLEFKMEQQGLSEHEWWLDEVALNLQADDPYPYAPRLAISLTPYGQNSWRGPTLVHYVQPLAPYLAGAPALVDNYLRLQADAQEEFFRCYGGVKGPIMPVHTRNDVENIALCGEEDFTRFSWWRRYRDFGMVRGFWHFNEALTDASGQGHTLAWHGEGDPAYNAGICQPGNTAAYLDGSHYLSCDSPDLNLGTEDFTIEMVVKPERLGLGDCLISKMSPGQPGFELSLGAGGAWSLTVADATGTSSLSPGPGLALTTDMFHYLAVAVDRDGQVIFCLDNAVATCPSARTGSLDSPLAFTLGRQSSAVTGFFQGKIDLLRVHRGRALSGGELQDNWRIIQGQLNGSAYPEVGCGLGQYWAFQRLAEFFFHTADTAAWDILENWLTWIDRYGASEGSGWKFPANFSEFGFTYGDYDPGQAASLALGCLFIHLRNGDGRAALWVRRLLDDLRQNRLDPNFGGYQTDRHYAWQNGLALRAFGLAANGAVGQSYLFPTIPEDQAHFEALMAWTMSHAGDVKPNVLNADLIPYAYSEAADMWEYAPNYLMMAQMGTLEAVVAMLGGALEQGKATGDWTWWQRLLDFILLDHLVVLKPAQLKTLSTGYESSGANNLVRVLYADYNQDNSKYAEARDEAGVASWGEQAINLDFRYGSPVVLEDPQVALLLAQRLLKRLSGPRELAEVETWLEGVRIELGDTVALSSDFHGLDHDEFTVAGKEVDLGRRAVRLSLNRPLSTSWSWALDAPEGSQDAGAIDVASSYDANWVFRVYAG